MYKCSCFFACILDWHSIYTVSTNINASSSNGRTADSDSVNRGSNPCEAATRKPPQRRFFCGKLHEMRTTICGSDSSKR